MPPFEPSTLKLGKKPARVDPRTIQLDKIIPSLPSPPPACDFSGGLTQFGMMLNGPNSYGQGVPSDGLGDCVPAHVAHGVQVARLNSPSGIVTPPDIAILMLYVKSCGYVIGNESTDQGGVIIDVLNYARQNAPWMKKKRWGQAGGGHKHPWQLLAYTDPALRDTLHLQQAIATFQVVSLGLQLPVTAQSQTGSLWDVVGNPQSDPNSQPGSWGGHAVVLIGYRMVGGVLQFLCITWGQLQWMTAQFISTYGDEAHALLYRARVEAFGALYPQALAQLMTELGQVTN